MYWIKWRKGIENSTTQVVFSSAAFKVNWSFWLLLFVVEDKLENLENLLDKDENQK